MWDQNYVGEKSLKDCFNNFFGATIGWICMFARPNIPKILTFLVKYLVPTTLNVGAALAHIFRHYYGWQMETSENGRVAVNRKLVKCDFHAKEARVVN